MAVLAVFNMKGGVGKTAAAVNIAHIAAAEGRRVLIWDLDPQGAASFYFRVKPKVKGGTKLVRDSARLDAAIKGTDFEGLDILPADLSYRALDVRLAKEKAGRLKSMMAPLRKGYDLVVLDCPPSLSELSEQVFRASDLLLVPMIPTTLSERTLSQLRAFLADEVKKAPPVRTLYSMVDRRKRLHREILESGGAERLEAVVPYASVVERMGIERTPVGVYAPRSAAADAFRAVWHELAPALG